jgi:hypothetical protein
LRERCRPVHTVKKLGSGDRGNANRLVGMGIQRAVEIEGLAFDGDEDR